MKKKSLKRIKPQRITEFIRQWALMLNAGITLLEALTILIKGTKKNDPRLSWFKDIKRGLEKGYPLSKVLSAYPNYINTFTVYLIEAGEHSGKLETVLNQIVQYRERSEALKKQVLNACFYPAIVLLMALGVSVVLLLYVVPQFKTLFDSFHAPLPAFTQSIIELSRLVQAHGLQVLGSCVAAIFLFGKVKKRSQKMQGLLDRCMLHLPVIKTVLQQAILTRSLSTLQLTLSAGMPLIQALELAAKTSGHVCFEGAFFAAQKSVKKGIALHQALRHTHQFPELLLQMIYIGETSGELDTMLQKSVRVYQTELDQAILKLTKLLEPLLMLFLGIVVGGLVVGMYLPMFKMGSVV